MAKKQIVLVWLRAVLAMFLLGISPLVFSQNALGTIRISMSPYDKAKYLHFMQDKSITDQFSYKSSDLDSAPVIDVILINKALSLGGASFTFNIVEVPNSERERAMVVSGEVDIAGTSQWDWWTDENAKAVYKSDVIVPSGAFEKGLYTTKEKAATLAIASKKDLANFDCVSSQNWKVDWKTLSALGFKSLQSVPTIDVMFKMVEAGRADVTVQSFSGLPDLSVTAGSITLYPIKGWKVLLSGSRHYAVSKASPNGAAIFSALQKGILAMRKNGEIDRALKESGFMNLSVQDWNQLKAP